MRAEKIFLTGTELCCIRFCFSVLDLHRLFNFMLIKLSGSLCPNLPFG